MEIGAAVAGCGVCECAPALVRVAVGSSCVMLPLFPAVFRMFKVIQCIHNTLLRRVATPLRRTQRPKPVAAFICPSLFRNCFFFSFYFLRVSILAAVTLRRDGVPVHECDLHVCCGALLSSGRQQAKARRRGGVHL